MEDDCSQVSSANQTIHMENILLSPQIDMLLEKNPVMLLHQVNSKYRETEVENMNLICLFDYCRLNSSIVKEMGNNIRFD